MGKGLSKAAAYLGAMMGAASGVPRQLKNYMIGTVDHHAHKSKELQDQLKAKAQAKRERKGERRYNITLANGRTIMQTNPS